MDGGDNDGLRCLRDSNNFRWASKNSHTSRPREITVKRVHVEAKLFFSLCNCAGINNLGDVGTFYQVLVFNLIITMIELVLYVP